MLFLSPLTLIGLSLIALPLAIHLLVRRRARRLDFPSLAFLRETPSFKLYPRHIRQPLLLALRAAAIILLVLGLARPLLTLHKNAPAAVRFILMDASLSMKTRGRAEAAREQARVIVNKLADGERASIISFSSDAKALVEASAERTRLLEAIDRYEPGGDEANYDAALSEVSRYTREREPQGASEVDVISDFQKAGLEKQLAPRAPALRIVAYPVGSSVERNAFLIDERVRKDASGIVLSATEIVSEEGGRRGANHTWTIDAGRGARSGLEWQTESNGQITGRIEVLEPDDFDADDERFFAFSAPPEARVLLVEDERDETLYLRAALEAAGGEGATRRLPKLPGRAEDLAPYSLVVLTLHSAPNQNELGALVRYARAGGTVWMCLGRDLDAESWNRLGRDEAWQGLPFESIARMSGQVRNFGAADVDAPELRSLDESALSALRAVRVNNGYTVAPRASASTLMRWNDGSPALVATHIGEGEILTLATSLEHASSDLGASPSFPALTSSILRAALREHEPLSRTIGEAVRLGVKPETDVKITDLTGRVIETKARELVRRPADYFNEPGIYRLEFAGQQKLLAFNSPATESERVLSSEESLKRLFSAEKTESARTVSESNGREAAGRDGSVWRYLLGAAFLLMLAELFVAIRQRAVVPPISE